MNPFEEKVLTDLAELKAHMSYLVGTGSEGKMQELENRVQRHEASLQRLTGVGGALGVLITMVHVALDYFRTVHR